MLTCMPVATPLATAAPAAAACLVLAILHKSRRGINGMSDIRWQASTALGTAPFRVLVLACKRPFVNGTH